MKLGIAKIKRLPPIEVDRPGVNSTPVIAGTKNLSPADTKRLIALTTDRDEKVRSPAIHALAGFADVSAVPELVKLLSDSDLKVRNDACQGLARLGTDARPALETLKKISGDDPLSDRAARAIRRIEGTEPAPDAFP